MSLMITVEQIKKHEGYRQYPYYCTGGKLTIGYGINLDAGITEEESEMILASRLDYIRRRLASAIPWYKRLSAPRQAVFINMAYNLGFSGLMAFKKTLNATQEGSYETASYEMLESKWANQVPSRAHELAEQMLTGEWQ